MSDANYPRLPKLVSIKLRVSTLNVLLKHLICIYIHGY